MPGLVMLSMPTMLILGLNAPIRVFVIAPLVLATVSLVMRVLLAKELFALTIVMTAVLAGLRRFWPPKHTELILSLGMQ